MERQDCDVIYAGVLAAGHDAAQVKSDLARLFKTDAAGIERLFSGQPVIIKKGIDPQTAEKYRIALEKAGAICEIRRHAPVGVISAATSILPTASDPDRLTIAPAGTILTEPAEVKPLVFDLSAISLAEPGVDLLDGLDTVTAAPLFDLSGLSMAPAGSELIESRPPERPSFPDFKELSVAPPGMDMDPRPQARATVMPDINGITLAPPGSAVLRPDEIKPLPLPPNLTKPGLSLKINDGQAL
jgi:hypothetical protein